MYAILMVVAFSPILLRIIVKPEQVNINFMLRSAIAYD